MNQALLFQGVELSLFPKLSSNGGLNISKKGLGFAVNLFLVSAIAWDVWQHLNPIFNQKESQETIITAMAAPKKTIANHSTPHLKVVDNWHPFGQPSTAKAQHALIPEKAPDTTLNLTLMGIIYADGSGQSARALIKGPSFPEKSFGIKDALPGDIKIAAIHPDRIILKRINTFETLRLPGKVKRETIKKQKTDQPSVKKGALRKLRESVLKHPERVLRKIRIEPLYKGGRFSGYQLFPGRKKGLLKQFGLQSGDIVKSINGVSMHSPLDGMRALGSLSNLTALHLRIMRNGQTKNFDFFLD